MPTLDSRTHQRISTIFQRLDYSALGPIYCDEGGAEFWDAHQDPCVQLGSAIAQHLPGHLQPAGRSLYIGAGVAEIPPLIMEVHELRREVEAYNLRGDEVRVLNAACRDDQLVFFADDAQHATGTFNHLWIVSVLNDPERFPELSDLAYGRAHPLTFDPAAFQQERSEVEALLTHSMQHLSPPALVTTSVEELAWITHWCEQRNWVYHVSDETLPTAIVQDPVCFVHIASKFCPPDVPRSSLVAD